MTERTTIAVVSDLIKSGLTVEQQILVHELLDIRRPRTDAERAKTYRERHDSHDERDARDERDAAPTPPRDIYNTNLGLNCDPNASLGKSLPEGPPYSPPQNDFDQFWAAYPRKVAKGAARRAYKNALKRATAQEIAAGVARYLATKPDPQFIKHPATWLNADCWADEPEPARTLKPNGYSNGGLQFRDAKPDPPPPTPEERARRVQVAALARSALKGMA